jgi:nitrate reductase NapAB chaperone NapD
MPLCFTPSPVLQTINGVLSQADGKDKLLRLVQFTMRFLSWSLRGQSSSVAACMRMEEALVNGRKLFRILRSLECLAKAQVLVQKMMKSKRGLLTSLELVQQGGFFSFFLVDHFFLLSKLRIITLDQQLIKQYFGGTFLVGCLGGVGANITRLCELQDVEAASSDDHVVSEKRHLAQIENTVDGIKNALDCVIGVNITYDKQWHRGVIGAMGCTTSVIWLWQHYVSYMSGTTLPQRLAIPEKNTGSR